MLVSVAAALAVSMFEISVLQLHLVSVSLSHLIKEQLSPLLFPEVHLFHSHLLAAVFLAGDAHDTRGALADFDEAVQVFPRVACRQTHFWCITRNTNSNIRVRCHILLPIPHLGWQPIEVQLWIAHERLWRVECQSWTPRKEAGRPPGGCKVMKAVSRPPVYKTHTDMLSGRETKRGYIQFNHSDSQNNIKCILIYSTVVDVLWKLSNIRFSCFQLCFHAPFRQFNRFLYSLICFSNHSGIHNILVCLNNSKTPNLEKQGFH